MERILVIDDNKHVGVIIKELLEAEGYSVDTALDGAAGMELTNNFSYQLVITDVFMPQKDGLEVLLELKQNNVGMGVIVITGSGPTAAMGNMIRTASYMGADRVLTKPLDYEHLTRVVKEVLELYH